MKRLFQIIALIIIFSFSTATIFAQSANGKKGPGRQQPDRPSPERPSPNHHSPDRDSPERRDSSRSMADNEGQTRPHRDRSSRPSIDAPNAQKKQEKSEYLNYLGERKSISNEDLCAKKIKCSTLTDNYIAIEIYFHYFSYSFYS